MQLHQDVCFAWAVSIALFILSLAFPSLAQTNVDEAGAAQLVQLINKERASQGIQPLAVDQRLAEAACEHSELMAAHKVLSHQFHEESTLAVRFADANLHSSQQAENIDFSKDVTSAHKGFMRSPANRATILDSNYNAVGVCAIRSHRHVYVTEDFAHRLKDYSEPEMDAALQRAIETYTTAHGMPTPVRKQESQLGHMACDMARSDSLQDQKAADLPGVQGVAAWTASVPEELPSNARDLLSHPISSSYSLGSCFAPSVSNPGGTYWVLMVVY